MTRCNIHTGPADMTEIVTHAATQVNLLCLAESC